MPTATPEAREWAVKTFGSMDLMGPQAALERLGFTLTVEYCWKRIRPPTEYEWKCIDFLIDEWDYGGYVED